MLIEAPNIHAEMRIRLLSLVVLALMSYLIMRLYEIQVSDGSLYAERLRNQITVAIQLPAAPRKYP